MPSSLTYKFIGVLAAFDDAIIADATENFVFTLEGGSFIHLVFGEDQILCKMQTFMHIKNALTANHTCPRQSLSYSAVSSMVPGFHVSNLAVTTER